MIAGSGILAALDDSVRALGVLRQAIELAVRFEARVYPFRAIAVPPDFAPAARSKSGDPLPDFLKAKAIDALLRLSAAERNMLEATGAGAWIEDPIIGFGQPWRAILIAATELDVALIVMGSHGYGGLDRILGTTAAKVANCADRSVLIVHERPSSEEHAAGNEPGGT